jgi:hypothetical protein
MVKPFVFLTRLVICVLAATSLMALGVSIAHPRIAPQVQVWTARWDSLNPQSSPDQPRVEERCYLIDLESNRCEVVQLPEENAWGPLSVSPWCDPEGNLEAVGPCYGLLGTTETQLSWGLARFRFPEGRIIEKVHLDLLPTGRPCWSPDRPGRILFAAGDGKLYRLDFPNDDGCDGLERRSLSTEANDRIPQPIEWSCAPLGSRSLVISDPVWPSDPRIRHLVFATATPQLARGERTITNAPQIWWFMLGGAGTTIEGAGRMFKPAPAGIEANTTAKRFPTIGVDRSGAIHLIYLARAQGKRSLRLEAVEIEVDPTSRQPRMSPGSRPVVLDSDSALIPPLVAADGLSVIGVSRSTGQLIRHRIDESHELQGRISLAVGERDHAGGRRHGLRGIDF